MKPRLRKRPLRNSLVPKLKARSTAPPLAQRRGRARITHIVGVEICDPLDIIGSDGGEKLLRRWVGPTRWLNGLPDFIWISSITCILQRKPIAFQYSICRCAFLNAPAGYFPKTSPVEWNRVMLTRDTLWRRKCRQALLNGSMARKVLASSSPMMAETMCSFTSARLNGRGFPAWRKVKRFLTKSKLTPGAVKAAQKTCGSDNVC